MRSFPEARNVLQLAIADSVFPGAQYAVLHGDEAIIDSIGSFTYDRASRPVTNETIFDIASLTKVVATTALAMLAWQRDPSVLDLPLQALVPEFANASDPRRAEVTLAMLLAHTSGLPAHRRLYEFPSVVAAPQQDQPRQAFLACARTPLLYEPGAHVEYSDLGFILLGEALRNVTSPEPHPTLDDLFRQQLANPLGLTHTRYKPSPGTRADVAPTCDWRWRHRCLQGEVHDENCAVLGGVAGHAGLFSDCADLLRFAHEMLEPNRLFRSDAIAHFSQTILGSRALGWDTPSQPSQSGRYFSPQTIGHLGYTGTSLWIDLRQQIAIVLLTNRVYTSPRAALMPQPEAIQRVRPAFHDAIMRELLNLNS